LPYIDPLDWGLGLTEQEVKDILLPVSVARCARLSYQSFTTQKRSTIEEDLELYQKLVGGRIIHASPAEHQATPDKIYPNPLQPDTPAFDLIKNDFCWQQPHLSGNLGPGWLQYRKMLPNEAIAPLPEGY